MDLAAIEEIRQLKYRYFRTLDLKKWDEFGDTLAADVITNYGTHALGEPLVLNGREAVKNFMRDTLGTAVTTVHVANHPELAVDGDTATGSWCFEDTVIVPESKVFIRGGGYYDDAYRRDQDGRWRISSTSYARIYESLISLDDLPSFQLLAHMWTAPPHLSA
jgi:hypothetical protein